MCESEERVNVSGLFRLRSSGGEDCPWLQVSKTGGKFRVGASTAFNIFRSIDIIHWFI